MPQQKDIFDITPGIEEIQPAAPEPAPQWQQTFEKVFPAAAQAAHQMAQVPQGLANMVTGIPNAVMHPLDTLSGMIPGAMQPFATVARGAGALVAPNSVQAPTQPEWDQATQGATGLAAGALIPAIPEAATMAGMPQAMVRAGNLADATPSWMLRHPLATAGKAVAGPLLRAGAKVLYEPNALPQEFIEPPTPPPSSAGYTDVAHKPVVPATQLEAPTAPKQLAPVKPGTQLFKGEEGGLPKAKEQVVTAIEKPKPGRAPTGRITKAEDVSAKKGNVGKGVTPKQ